MLEDLCLNTVKDHPAMTFFGPTKPRVDIMVKRHRGAIYLLAANMTHVPTIATFRIDGLKVAPRVTQVVGPGGSTVVSPRGFSDQFKAYQTCVYRIAMGK